VDALQRGFLLVDADLEVFDGVQVDALGLLLLGDPGLLRLDQARRAVLDGASYLGIGPTFTSSTKEFGELAGLSFLTAAMSETSLPAFAIGGVNLETIDAAVAAGARRVAVSAAIAQAEEPRQVARALHEALVGR